MKVIRTHVYIKRANKLLSEDEMMRAEQEIILAPDSWSVISGTGGVRKARATKGSSGKRGGVRILYYFMVTNTHLYLLDIYAKNEQENITEASKKMFRDFVKTLKGDGNE